MANTVKTVVLLDADVVHRLVTEGSNSKQKIIEYLTRAFEDCTPAFTKCTHNKLLLWSGSYPDESWVVFLELDCYDCGHKESRSVESCFLELVERRDSPIIVSDKFSINHKLILSKEDIDKRVEEKQQLSKPERDSKKRRKPDPPKEEAEGKKRMPEERKKKKK